MQIEAARDSALTEEEAIEQAAMIIRRWERDGHWTALPEAREIMALFNRIR